MLTLIKRELEDHLINFLIAVLLSASLVAVITYTAVTGLDETVGLFMSLGIIVLVGCCGLGVVQMYTDRANRISPFLATLAVTRGQILAARIIVGVLAILTALLPTVIASVILLSKFVPPIAFYWRAIVDVSATAFLVALTCYGAGLVMGSSTRKLHLLAGCLVVPPAALLLVLAKGFGPQAMMILGLLILASIGRVATRFSSTPL